MKILLKDLKRIQTYGETHDCDDWEYKNGYFIVKGERYSRENDEVIYEPTKEDYMRTFKDMIKYYETYSTIRKEMNIDG